ncbi:MAG: IS1595 family transposase [Syntrophotaleaceae bacterium]
MNVEELRRQFPDEESCRAFFESVIWPDGPICPHCHGDQAWKLQPQNPGRSLRMCRMRQAVYGHDQTPFHGTKLSLWLWLQAMYSLIFSSKGASSVFIAKWLGISQKSAWKMLHALRTVMAVHRAALPKLQGIVELDENTWVANPVIGQASNISAAVEPQELYCCCGTTSRGPVRATPVAGDSVSVLQPLIQRVVSDQAHLMSDELHAYRIIGRGFCGP